MSATTWMLIAKDLCKKQTFSNYLKDNASAIATLNYVLFLLHPVQTQTVTYVIQGRFEGLATLLILGSIYFFLQQTYQSYASSFLCLFLAFGTKEIAIIAPLLIFMIDLAWLNNFSLKNIKSRLALHAAYVIFAIALSGFFLKLAFFKSAFSLTQTAYNNRGNILTASPTSIISAYEFMLSQFRVILHYFRIFILPLNLCVEYDFMLPQSFFSASVLLPFLTLCGIGLYSIYALFKSNIKYVGFGVLWFLIAIAPRSSIIPCAEIACDYKTYLASCGMFFIFSVWLAPYFSQNIKTLKDFVAHPLFLLIAALGLLSYNRNLIWKTPVQFWENIVMHNPNKARARNNLGVALTEAEKITEAEEQFHKSIELDKYYPDPLSNLAIVLSAQERYEEAIESLKKSISILSDYPEGYNNLAALLFKVKRVDEAIPLLDRAIALKPFYGKALFNLGRCYLEKGENLKAWSYFKRATEADLDTMEGFCHLASASFIVEKFEEAEKALIVAIKKGFDTFDGWFSLGNSIYLQGRFNDAEKIYKKTIDKFGDEPRAIFNLAESLFSQEKLTQAREYFLKLKHLNNEFPQAFAKAALCEEKQFGIGAALKFWEDHSNLSWNEEHREFVRNEKGRLRLQNRINAGNCTMTGKEFHEMFQI